MKSCASLIYFLVVVSWGWAEPEPAGLLSSSSVPQDDNLIALCLTKYQVKYLLRRELYEDLEVIISNFLYLYDRGMHQVILGEVIDEELNNTNAKLVIKFVSKQNNESLNYAYMKIYTTIKRKSLDDGVLFELAVQIIADSYKCNVVTLLNLFPPSVRALLSSSTKSIRNRGYNEYFFAADNGYKHDAERRHVFTWRPRGDAQKTGDWNLQHIAANRFRVISARYNEYLYAEDGNDRERRVFTRGGTGDGSVWAVELDGNDVLFRNVHHDEYMYAGDGDRAYHDHQRRRVFAGRRASVCGAGEQHCRWIVDTC